MVVNSPELLMLTVSRPRAMSIDTPIYLSQLGYIGSVMS